MNCDVLIVGGGGHGSAGITSFRDWQDECQPHDVHLAGGGGGGGQVITVNVNLFGAITVTVGAAEQASSVAGVGTAAAGGRGRPPVDNGPGINDKGSGAGGACGNGYGGGGGLYAGAGGGGGMAGGGGGAHSARITCEMFNSQMQKDNSGKGGTGANGVVVDYSGAGAWYGSGGGGGGYDDGGPAGAWAGQGGGGPKNVSNAGYYGNGGGGAAAGSPTFGYGMQGIVIIRYAGGQLCTGGAVSSAGGYTIHTFTSSGTFSAPLVPTLSSIAPTYGYRGEDTYVNLYGTDFINGGSTINTYTNGGMSLVGGPYWGASTNIAGTFRLTTDALLGGNHLIGVTTAGGFTGWAVFSAVQRPPVISSTDLASITQGAYVGINIYGSQFCPDSLAINISGTGVTVAYGPIYASTGHVWCHLSCVNAPHGMRTVTVSHVGGTSNAANLMVYGVPTITEIDNTQLGGTYDHTFIQGTSNVYTHFWGTALTNPTGATISGTGVTTTMAAFGNETIIALYMNIAADAPLGTRTITVNTPGGTSNAMTITILPQAPTLVNMGTWGAGPSQGFLGIKERVVINGTNFVAGAGLTINVADVTVTNVVIASATQLYADFTGTALGAKTVSVTTTGGTTATTTFTVLAVTALPSAGMIVNQILGSSVTTALSLYPLQFTPTSDRIVTHLGRWKYSGSTGSHVLILRNSSGVEINRATVNLASGAANEWVYTTLATQVALTAGQTYTLEEQAGAAGDTWANLSPVATDGNAVINGPVISGAASGYAETFVTLNLQWRDGAGQQMATLI